MRRMLMVAMAVLALALALTACAGPTPTPSPPATTPQPAPLAQSLTIYSGRAETLVGPILQQFSQTSGIKVSVKYGDTAPLAATILEEGARTPADVFFATDPGGLGEVSPLFSRLPDSLLNKVPPKFRSPHGRWVGISGRARVVTYNTKRLTEAELPDDIWYFTDPKWKGRIGWAPTNASLQAMVTAMRRLWGEERTRQWLRGIQANSPKDYRNNTAIVAAVGSGEVEVGFSNHYYLFRFLQEQGEAYPARNYHPRAGGPGAIILVAGAGILETSKNKETAQRFLEFLLTPVAQQYFAGQTFEYPVVGGVTTHRLLVPLAKINAPEVDMAELADLKGTLNLLRETGVLP